MNYAKLRPKIKTGDLISWEGRGLVSGVIRHKTHSPITHSSIVFRTIDNRIMIAESTGKKGVHLCFLSDKLKEYKGIGYHSHLRTTQQHRDALYKPILTALANNIEYDSKDLFKQLWRRVEMDPEQMFCSEFVLYCWIEAKIVEPQKLAAQPGGLAQMYCVDQMVEMRI